MQEKLQRSNTRLAQLISNLEGGVLVEDETRHISLVNQAFCDMFGIPVLPDLLIGTDCSNSADESKGLFVNPDQFVSRILTILKERKPVHNEVLHLMDGRVFARDYIPVFDTDKYIGHLWHYHDITEDMQSQRRLERLLRFEAVNKEINRLFLQFDNVDDALNQSLAMTGQLLDVSRVYVFRIRDNERILDNTHEWCAPGVTPEIDNLKGLPFDELFPSLFPMIAEHDLIAPRHISELPDDLRGVLEPQDIQTILWMPMYSGNRIEGFVGYDETRHPRDWLPEEITMARIVMESYSRTLEREHAAETLIKTRDEAIRTAQIRAQFVANMSHEIRTPMTGILGMLELLLETELSELQQEFATEAFRSSSHLLAIINDILDFSKLDAGQVILEANAIDLRAIATEVKMTLNPQIKEKPLTINLEIDQDVPQRVFGDATRIRQVLMNLVGNAVKFTHQGKITLTIQMMSTHENTAYLRFTVRDTGIGISEENLTRIFDSFIQADGSTTRKYGGSGLGLSISKQLVELMGSEITVESTMGEGSAFSFLLCLPVAQWAGIETIVDTDFGSLNVLLVDTNRTICYVLAQQLENWGVSVTQVSNLSDLQHLKPTQPFDIIFYRFTPEDAEAVRHFGKQIIHIVDAPPPDSDKSTIYIQLPIDQSSLYNLLIQAIPIHTPPPANEVEEEQPSKGRVLLVDDNIININLILHALNGMNVEIDYVKNGQEALHKIEDHHYDIILMDMQMPVMDGMEATRRIRKLPGYDAIPIIAVTAGVTHREQDNYMASGVNAIVSKPFSVKYLREIVIDWLENPPTQA